MKSEKPPPRHRPRLRLSLQQSGQSRQQKRPSSTKKQSQKRRLRTMPSMPQTSKSAARPRRLQNRRKRFVHLSPARLRGSILLPFLPRVHPIKRSWTLLLRSSACHLTRPAIGSWVGIVLRRLRGNGWNIASKICVTVTLSYKRHFVRRVTAIRGTASVSARIAERTLANCSTHSTTGYMTEVFGMLPVVLCV